MDYYKSGGILELMLSNLKVRVWHKGLEKFLPKEEWFLDFNGNLFFYPIVIDMNSFGPRMIRASEDLYEVNRCTGMYDKNGQEIYEGDIIRGALDFGPAGWIEQQLSVKWNEREGYQWNYWNIPTIEVVGNIYTGVKHD
jgi:uncharacterized phage protein (TIGR01671 family)